MRQVFPSFVGVWCSLLVVFVLQEYGGRVVQEVGPHTVLLVQSFPSSSNTTATQDDANTFSFVYIRECVKEKKLLPLKHYW